MVLPSPRAILGLALAALLPADPTAAALLSPHMGRSSPAPAPAPAQAPFLPDSQHPIALETSPNRPGALPLKTAQNATLCDAGSRQWTGFVPVGPGRQPRDMFYWYFEARHAPEAAPLLVWVNGGPGASSLLGALFEVGPCTVSAAPGDGTARNPLGWTEVANVVFVDQPIGVGFSRTKDESLSAATLLEAGADMDRFLDAFTTDAFPELAGRAVHFAGESFGGRYVPVYAAVASRRRSFASVILVDPYVDPANHALGFYDRLCPLPGGTAAAGPERSSLNETACAAMRAAYPRCETLHRACVGSYDADLCRAAEEGCAELMGWFMSEVRVGGRHPYDDRRVCEANPPLCGGMGMDEVGRYLNTASVQRALGLRGHFTYDTVSWAFNERFGATDDAILPSTREIAALLDRKGTRVLVVNGNNDVIINTEGIVKTFDELKWSGQADFRRLPYRPWQYADDRGAKRRGGDFKTLGNLSVVTVDEAGHMSPHDEPVATLEVLRRWIDGTELEELEELEDLHL